MTSNNKISQVIGIAGVLENALLSAPYPIVIFEGLELRVTYINDALLEIWEKDRSIIGQTFTAILPELEDQPFPALIRQVIETGISHTDTGALSYFMKDGVRQSRYFDYSYTPINNNENTLVGVLVICKDVTEQVLAKQKARESEEKFRNSVLQAPFAIAVLQGPEFIVETVNEQSLSIWGRTKDVVGKRVADVSPEVIEQGFIDILTNVYNTGEPFYGNELPIHLFKNGQPSLAYLNFVYHPVFENNQVTSIMFLGYDVTDQVLSRKKAEESELKFRNIVLQAPVAMAILQGPDFIIETANQKSLDMWKKDAAVIGKKVAEVFPEYIEQGFLDILKNVFDTAKPYYGNEVPFTIADETGTRTIYSNFVYQPILEDNKVASIVALNYDVTDLVTSRQNAEERGDLWQYLNVAGEELALALDTQTALEKISKLIVPKFADWLIINILKDDNLEILMVVNKDQEYVNWAKEYRLQKPVTIDDKGAQGHVLRTGESVMMPKVTDAILEAAINDKAHLEVIKKMNLRSSIIVPMKIGSKIIGTISLLSTVEGKEYNATDLDFAKDFAIRIGLALENARLHEEAYTEIAERKKVEIALRESEEQFRSLSNAIPQLAWMTDKDGWIFWYNQRWYEYTGTTLEEMQGWGWEKVHHPDHKQRVINFVEVAWKKGEPYELTFPLRSKDGEWRWFLTRVVPIFDSEGQQVRWFGTNTDITEQKEALELNEKLLQEMEFERNRFEAVVKQMPGSVVIGEAPSGKLIFANDKINEVWGHPLKESEEISEYFEWVGFHPDGRRYEGHEWPLARSIQNGEIVSDEDVDIIRGDGKPAILRLSSAPIRDNSGKIIAGVGISQDVTELKRAIRARDEFLSIASHELKTPLTTLTASIQILMRVYEKDISSKSIPALISTSNKSANKLANLIRELLNVSRIESGQLKLNKTTFNLAELVNECCQHVRLEGSHELLVEGDTQFEVFADQPRIDQVIVNFVNNAVKYAPDSPTIKLLIENVNNEARFSVMDEGIGIEEEKIPHLFERYYRVDPTGTQYSGLGLGLYISSEIIKLHGGKIGVKSKLGEGSTFWFTVPLSD